MDDTPHRNGQRPWTDADDAAMRAGHAEGKSLHQIATEMGRGKATISRKASDAGLTWDRAQVHAATVAKTRDAKGRRADALQRELEILELAQARVLDTMRGEKRWDTVLKGEAGSEHDTFLAFIPSRDFRDETSSRNSIAQIIDRLTDDDNGATEAISMLQKLADRIGVTGPAE